MTIIELEIHDDVISTLNKIKNINDSGIELHIPEGSVLFENILNLKLIEKEIESVGKAVQFRTRDEYGLNLLAVINGESITQAPEEVITDLSVTQSVAPKREIKIPAISLPKINIGKLNLPKTGFIIPVVVLGVLLYGGYSYATNAPKAEIKVIVNTQPLTKSVTMKIKRDGTSDALAKVVRGIPIEAENTITKSIDTTGEKLIGEKAEGTVKFYNKTDSDIELKKGTILTYEDLEFVLDKTITIPARVDDLVDPTKITLGEEEGTVTAKDIGDDYNIGDGKSLKVDDYKNTDLVATSEGKFSGGTSEKVKVVADKDLTDLSTAALEEGKSQVQAVLTQKLGLTQKIVTGSATVSIVKDTFSAKAGDEADKVETTQVTKITALAYSTDELNQITSEILKDLVPEEYVLTDKEPETNVEILGNSDSTILSSEEADIQVTVKTFVITDIKEDELKDKLKGKNLDEAQKILGEIRNVSTYELKIDPNIPLVSKVPAKTENIVIEIETEN